MIGSSIGNPCLIILRQGSMVPLFLIVAVMTYFALTKAPADGVSAMILTKNQI